MEATATKPKQEKYQEDLLEVVNLIKKEGIGQVIIHGKELYKEGKKTGDMAFDSDLDAQMALTLLNDYNNLSTEKLYTKGATSSIIPMGGSQKDLTYKNPNGVRIFLDVGGEWLKIKEKDGKTTTVHIDHHGEGKGEATSATKMVYEILKEGDLLSEEGKKDKKLKDFVNFVNDFDNLSYRDNKDKEGNKVLTKKWFKYTWPRTLYAMADNIPPDIIFKLYKEGKIKDLSKPFTRKEIEGEIGDTVVGKTTDKKGKEKYLTIRDICKQKEQEARIAVTGVNQADKYAEENKLNLDISSLGGKIVFQNFPQVKTKDGKLYTNKIPQKIAYLASLATGHVGIAFWNPKNTNGDRRFFFNANSPEVSKIAKELMKIAPGTTDVRGIFIFPPKNREGVENITQEQFLNIIDPKILENAKVIKGEGFKEEDNEYVVDEVIDKDDAKKESNEIEIKKLKEKLKKAEKANNEEEVLKIEDQIRKLESEGGEEIDEDEEGNIVEETLETKEGEPVDTKKLAKEKIKTDPEQASKELKEKIISEEEIKEEREEAMRREMELQSNLEEIRNKYAQAYTAFMEERKKKAGFFTRIKRTLVGETVKDNEIPESLKKLEIEYTKATALYGQSMYENAKRELALSNLSPEEQAAKLEHYKQREIFGEVVINEEQRLSALKAEGLPPKEKSIFRKGLDWYMKQNRFVKVAVSVGLSTIAIATFMPSMVAAGGGIAAYIATKFGRGIIGGAVGQLAAKGYDLLVKEKYTQRKEESLEELQKKFGDNISEQDLLQYKKEYAEILEKERKSKRNRLIHKAGIAILAGAGTAIEGQHLLNQYFSATGVIDNGTGTQNATEHIFKAGKPVEFSSRGSIQTIENLKMKINADYGGDFSKAPHSIQEFMKTNSTQEAIKLGFYNPNSTAESAMMLKGSTLGFDEHGNLSYHDIKTGQTHNLITEQGNAETTEKYGGKMFDAHKSGINTTHDTNLDNQEPIKIDGAADDLTNQKPINIDGSSSGDLTHQAPIDINGSASDNLGNQQPIKIDNTANNIDGQKPINIDNASKNLDDQQPIDINGASNHPLDQTQNLNENTNLTPEQLTELTKTTKIVYESNIHKIFPNEQSLQAWDSVKNSNSLHPAEQFISWKGPVNETFEPLVNHMKTLSEVTKLSPNVPDTYPPIPLTAEEYITHATQKAAEMGPEYLEKVKYK